VSSKTVYIFRCGTTALYALTTDKTGDILPLQFCGSERWQLEGAMAPSKKNTPKYELYKATLAVPVA
jgi:hypothetical protein